MTFHDKSCGSDNNSDKVNYMNVTAAAAVADSTNMNVFENRSSNSGLQKSRVVIVEHTKTATSGHHEVTHNEINQQVQLKRQQRQVSPPKPISGLAVVGFRQLNYGNKNNNNKAFSIPTKTFVARKPLLQRHSLVYLILTFFITIQFATHNTLAIFKISPQEWLKNCNKTGQQPFNSCFVDSRECLKTLQQSDTRIGEIEWLLMILQCDGKPMIKLFETFLPLYNGPEKLTTPNELFELATLSSGGGGSRLELLNSRDKLEKWRELLVIESLINHFYAEAMQALSRSDFCTYPTISRLGKLKSYVLGSKTLGYAYDLIAIQLHTNCLIKTLNKLPQVPYLVKDIVDTYMNGVDNLVQPPNNNKSFNNYNNSDDESDDGFAFDADEAIARNGPLSLVVQLSLSLPISFGLNHSEEQFKEECKNFLIELEERWQTMEMMSKMLSTDFNGIQRFNNYVMRLLVPTKYADACSKLSSRS